MKHRKAGTYFRDGTSQILELTQLMKHRRAGTFSADETSQKLEGSFSADETQLTITLI
jgi:hypothetical protein